MVNFKYLEEVKKCQKKKNIFARFVEEDEVGRLIQSTEDPDVFICNDCVDDCVELLDSYDYYDENNSGKKITLLKPKEIKVKLDEYIIGQENAKKILSVAVSY